MKVERELTPHRPRDRRAVLTIGSFDGVHRGHRTLVEETVRLAHDAEADAALLTFDPHPRCVLDPGNCPPTLTPLPEKAARLADLGIDRMVVLPFTRELSELSAEAFCEFLRASFDLVALVVGYDFALGRRRQGDVAFLRQWGAAHGIAVSQAEPLELGPHGPVSSSRVRVLLADGDVGGAAEALGYGYRLSGPVQHGEKMGRTLGYPTVNIGLDPGRCVPANGVYATWVRVRGAWVMGATSVGVRPTFNGSHLTVEAYLLDFNADVYGENVECVFVERLREERRYTDVAELVSQMGRDVEEARRVLHHEGPPRT